MRDDRGGNAKGGASGRYRCCDRASPELDPLRRRRGCYRRARAFLASHPAGTTPPRMAASSPIPRPSRRFSKPVCDACGDPVTEVARIADDTHVLSDLVPADGRVSWVAPGLSGYEPYNEYLVIGDERALLIDTGVGVARRVDPRTAGSTGRQSPSRDFISRIELDCIGNLALLLDHFESVEVATANPIPAVDLVHRSTTSSVSVTHFGVDQTLAPGRLSADDRARSGAPHARHELGVRRQRPHALQHRQLLRRPAGNIL